MAETLAGPGTGEAKTANTAAPPDVLDLRGKLDRFGDIVSKSLDLAEIGMNLSLSLISALSTVAQQKIGERLMEPIDPGAAAAPVPVAPAHSPPRAAEPTAYGLTNRLRLVPGASVAISFSVNNDSASEPKPVSLQVETFAGDRSGRELPRDALRVVPQGKAINPMDFEKFVLEGELPGDTIPDTYRGTVVVTSDDVMRIPVWLVIDRSGPDVGPAAPEAA